MMYMCSWQDKIGCGLTTNIANILYGLDPSKTKNARIQWFLVLHSFHQKGSALYLKGSNRYFGCESLQDLGGIGRQKSVAFLVALATGKYRYPAGYIRISGFNIATFRVLWLTQNLLFLVHEKPTPQKTTIPGRNLGRWVWVFEVEIVGDDLYCTNTKRVQMGLGVSGDGLSGSPASMEVW